MKNVILIRHAKSSWDNPEWSDFERPLNKRGFDDAPKMSELFSTKNLTPEIIYSSPAKRAMTTAKIFAEKLNYPQENIILDNGIYEKGSKYIIKLLYTLDSEINTVAIFGHNPDLTSLASYFSGEYIDNIPTCGIIAIEFNSSFWQDFDKNNGKILFFEYPKLYK